MKRNYKQNCALAHSLDLVGERWTLLIVRELLISPRRYGQLSDNLPGMGTNLLATRLKELAASDLIEKVNEAYQLTPRGKELEPVVHAMVRFGMAINVKPASEELHRPEWDAVALKALYQPQCDKGLRGRYLFELNGVPFCIDKSSSGLTVTQTICDDPKAGLSLSKEVGRQIAAGELSVAAAIESGALIVSGNKTQAQRLMCAFGMEQGTG